MASLVCCSGGGGGGAEQQSSLSLWSNYSVILELETLFLILFLHCRSSAASKNVLVSPPNTEFEMHMQGIMDGFEQTIGRFLLLVDNNKVTDIIHCLGSLRLYLLVTLLNDKTKMTKLFHLIC